MPRKSGADDREEPVAEDQQEKPRALVFKIYKPSHPERREQPSSLQQAFSTDLTLHPRINLLSVRQLCYTHLKNSPSSDTIYTPTRQSRKMPSSNRSSSTSSSASDTSKKPKTWRILSTEYKELGNGKQFSRKIDLKTGLPKTEWQEVAKPPSSSSGSSQEEQHKLYLVLQKQAEGEPDHWSLFATRGGELTSARGKVWQVKGDALSMRHVPANNVAIFASGSFKAHYVLCSNLTADMENKVEAAAAREAPPKAANQAAVVENCQGWTIRVLRRLEKEGVVKKETVNQMSKLKQPIRK